MATPAHRSGSCLWSLEFLSLTVDERRFQESKARPSHGGTGFPKVILQGPQCSSLPPGGAAERPSGGGNAALGPVPDSAALPPAGSGAEPSGWRGLALLEGVSRNPPTSAASRSVVFPLPRSSVPSSGERTGCRSARGLRLSQGVTRARDGVVGGEKGWSRSGRSMHGPVLSSCWSWSAPPSTLAANVQVALACRLLDRGPAQSSQSGLQETLKGSGPSQSCLGWPALLGLFQSDDGPLHGDRE